MNVLAISGSLRRVSSNTTLLRAAAALAPADMTITRYDGLDALPHFNPDIDEATEPEAVHRLRSQVRSADGVLISSPEYAHGVPGSLKNALDWLVSSGETVDKPFALFNATPPATHAQATLTEILTVMTARLIPDAALTLPLRGKKLTEAEMIAHQDIAPAIRAALLAFAQAIAASHAYR